jgi:hypothetical protein
LIGVDSALRLAQQCAIVGRVGDAAGLVVAPRTRRPLLLASRKRELQLAHAHRDVADDRELCRLVVAVAAGVFARGQRKRCAVVAAATSLNDLDGRSL